MNNHLDAEPQPVSEVLHNILITANAPWDLAEAHGACCGWACLGGSAAIQGWAEEILGRVDLDDALDLQRQRVLYEFAARVQLGFEKGDLDFELLLPDDSALLGERIAALADWCQGFMHGLAAGGAGDTERVEQAMARGATREILDDFGEITRAAVGEESADVAEQAYAELVEYIRASVQLIYEDTAGFRKTLETSQ
jgi:uncharacterized protein YgfB (UPF0149 family)